MQKSITQRVKKSMMSMLIMRPISAIGGLLTLILLSRILSSVDYGKYFAIWAIVEISILASNFGLIHAAYRYVSSIECIDNIIVTHGPIWKLVFLRMFTLVTVGVVVIVQPKFLNWLSKEIVFDNQALLILITIIFFEGLARFFEVIFDSILCQGRSQISLVSRTIFRLLGYISFFHYEILDLRHVLYADFIATALGALMAMLMLCDVSRKSKLSGRDSNIENISFKRMTQFAFPAFIAQVLTLFYGPDALKLVLSSSSGMTALASFGYAYSLASVVQRYIPANLLGGMLRPIFVAASKKPNSNEILSNLLSVSIKINWLIILPIVCFLFFAGTPLLTKLSGGKYADAGNIIVIIMLGLLAISVHITFSMYCLARETSLPTLYATIFSILGLPLGIVLAEKYGAVGVAIAFGTSELIWSIVCFIILRSNAKGGLTVDWLGLIKLIGSALISIILCSFLNKKDTVNQCFVLGVLACFIFFLITYFSKMLTKQEQLWAFSVLPLGKIFKVPSHDHD